MSVARNIPPIAHNISYIKSLRAAENMLCKSAALQLLLLLLTCLKRKLYKRGGAQEVKANCNIMNVGGGVLCTPYSWKEYSKKDKCGDGNSALIMEW